MSVVAAAGGKNNKAKQMSGGGAARLPAQSAESIEKDAESDESRLASQARCIDGRSAKDLLSADVAKRREMVKALALEKAVPSARPFFLRMFLASGLLDQLRFLWCASHVPCYMLATERSAHCFP